MMINDGVCNDDVIVDNYDVVRMIMLMMIIINLEMIKSIDVRHKHNLDQNQS